MQFNCTNSVHVSLDLNISFWEILSSHIFLIWYSCVYHYYIEIQLMYVCLSCILWCWWTHISSRGIFFCRFVRIFTYTIISTVTFLPLWYLGILLSFFNCSSSITMLNTSGENRHLCLVHNLRSKVFSLSIFGKMLPIIIKLTNSPSVLVKVLQRKQINSYWERSILRNCHSIGDLQVQNLQGSQGKVEWVDFAAQTQRQTSSRIPSF